MNEAIEWNGKEEAEVMLRPLERVTMEEIQEAIKQMKSGKAVGISDVAVEHISASGMVGVEVLTEICNRVLDGMPKDWMFIVLGCCIKGKEMCRIIGLLEL